MLMRFFMRMRGDYESVLSQDERSGEDGVDPEGRKKTELAMRRKVTPLTPS